MRSLCCLMAFVMLFMINILSCEAEEEAAAEDTLAVIPLEDISENNNKHADIDPADIMTEELTAALEKSEHYTVVERDRVETLLDEMGYSANSTIDQNGAVEVGKMLDVRYVVLGKVTMSKLNASGKMLGLKSNANRSRAKISLNYRLIDVQSGEIKFAGMVKGEGEGSGDEDTVMYEACQDAAQNVLKDVLIDLKAEIADISSDKIYIDGGKKLGFSEGETLIVVRDSKPIKINGKVVGIEEIKLGKVKVIEVKDDYAVCKITKQNGGVIQKGDFVKREKKRN